MGTGFALSWGLILAVGLLCCVVCYLMIGCHWQVVWFSCVDDIYFNCGLGLLCFWVWFCFVACWTWLLGFCYLCFGLLIGLVV